MKVLTSSNRNMCSLDDLPCGSTFWYNDKVYMKCNLLGCFSSEIIAPKIFCINCHTGEARVFSCTDQVLLDDQLYIGNLDEPNS